MPSATSSGEPLLAVDQNAQPRRLIGLAEQRYFVDGAVAVDAAGGVARAHQERMDDALLRRRKPFGKAVFGYSFIRKPTVPRCMP